MTPEERDSAPRSASNAGPIFVVGSPRSGTSLLYYLLAAHRDLAYPDLGLRRMRQARPLRLLSRLGLPVYSSRALHARFLPRAGETPYEDSLRFLGLDPALPQEGSFVWSDLLSRAGIEIQQLRPEHLERNRSLARGIRARYRGLSARTGRRRFVDKSPDYTVILDALRALFPAAHIVHIIRDGRAVVNSVAYAFKYRRRADGTPWASATRKWWGPRPRGWEALEDAGVVERACHQWADLVTRGRRGRELFGDRQYSEIRYESLVSATEAEMRTLFERLGLDPVRPGFYPERMEDRNYKWRSTADSFGDPIWTDRNGIAPEEYPQLEVMRPLLESLGYVERGGALAPAGEGAS